MTEQKNPQDLPEQLRIRREKRQKLIDAGVEPYPVTVDRTTSLRDLRAKFVVVPEGEDAAGEEGVTYLGPGEETDVEVAVAGRLIFMRNTGKLCFATLQDGDGTQLQAMLSLAEVGQEALDSWKADVDLGDFVSVRGRVIASRRGELSIMATSWQMASKALRPLPVAFADMSEDTRVRHRYTDLIMREQARTNAMTRIKVMRALRNHLEREGFVEVETPMLQAIPGGATARPFKTHHNALDIDMFLRIAPELYLKRLVVGGFEKVFEINRNFRNEGLSTRHNPEFTMIEFYQAYADYHDLMDLTEEMLRSITQEVLGTTTVVNTLRNSEGEVLEHYEYDFGSPLKRITVFDSILEYNPDIHAEALADEAAARQIAERLDIDVKDGWGLGKIQIEIFEKTVEHRLKQPTFVTEYPTEVSPLARRKDSDPFVTERFEFFVGGREIANGFSELNDAEDQAERFREQVAEKEAGDDEAMYFDADYVRALEYGLPPTAGEGIGIDRLVMLLTDSASIRDVLLFPAMRPEVE